VGCTFVYEAERLVALSYGLVVTSRVLALRHKTHNRGLFKNLRWGVEGHCSGNRIPWEQPKKEIQ